MKTILTILICAALVGCSHKQEPDPQLIEMQRRFIGIENRLAVIEDNLTKQEAINKDTLTALKESNDFIIEQNTLNVVLSSQIAQHIADGGAHPSKTLPQIKTQPASNVRQKMSNGVPSSVYSQIATLAARHWPGNYDMQEYVVRQQIEAYRKLNP